MELKQKIIDGKTFQIRPLTTRIGLRVFAKLMKMLGPSLSGSKSGALSVLINLDSDSVIDMAEEFAKQAIVVNADGGQLPLHRAGADDPFAAFDAVFSGKLPMLVAFLKFAVEVNYGDFLDTLAADDGTDLTPLQVKDLS